MEKETGGALSHVRPERGLAPLPRSWSPRHRAEPDADPSSSAGTVIVALAPMVARSVVDSQGIAAGRQGRLRCQ